jgi:class 3 adenylate cyclase/tetratricopeptide (TPR) repeat protein
VRTVTDLRRHVPRVALEWDDEVPDRAWQSVDATLVFADISGFTALTERLARRGRIGAEELIETLNRVFGAMLDMAAIRGGELLKFGGDALLFTFRGEDHTLRACRSAVDMRQALREAAKVPTSVGKLRLSMSVGIHSGPVDFFLVGAPTRELLILGPAATATAEAEHAAVAGQILITASTAAKLPPNSTELREDGLHRLRWRFTFPPEGEGPPPPEVSEGRLRSLFPNALGDYLDDRVPDPEHKVATIGFARFSGTDRLLVEQGHDAVATALHTTISVFEDALIAEGVTLLATDLDSDGGKLFMSSGVPFSTEDDEGRMVRAMRRVLDTGTPLPLQIGVNRGHVFAAEVGAAARAAYSAMGDTTNTAARIMAKAPHGVLFAHPTVLEQSRTLFETEPAGPFAMKGKTVPVPVFAIGEELGTRGAETREALPLIGRDDELAALREALDHALGGEGGVITVSAATGLGKSRVIAEAMRGLEVVVASVRAEPYGMTSPYRMLRDPVRGALGVERGDPAGMTAQVLESFARLAPDLLPLAPLLEDVVNIPIPSTPEAAAIEPRFRPARIADIVVRLIEATVPGRFVLMVEEGHWSDGASITVLERVAAATRGRPWAVVVARRVDGDGFAPEDGTQIVLGPLPDDAMRRIVIAATATSPLRPHEVDEIVKRAGGNPLYVEELARVFREVGSLEAMPESLHAALDAQIDALDTRSRRILRYASVLGRSFRTEVLAETLRAEGLEADDATLTKLTGYLESDGRTRLRFRTGMIRDAAYEGLAYRLRARLHAAAGAAVEALSTDLDADADTLSLHFSRGGDQRATWRYARMAGDRAARAYANVDAAVQYERALEAARRLPDISDDQLLTLLTRLAEVRNLTGLYETSVEALRQAARLVRDEPSRHAAVLLQKARIRQRAGTYRLALRDVTTAERLIGDHDGGDVPTTRVRLEAVRLSVRFEQGKRARVVAEAPTIIAEARTVGDDDSLILALGLHDICSVQLGDLSVGENLREAVDLSLRTGNLRWALRAQMAMAGLALYSGDWSGAVAAYAGAREAAIGSGDVVSDAQVVVNLAEILVWLGRADEADGLLEDAIRVLRVARVNAFAVYGELQRGRVLLERGNLAEAERLLESVELESIALDDPSMAAEALLVRAEVLTLQGRPEDALAVLATLTSTDGDDVVLRPRAALEQARAEAALGRNEDARRAVLEGLAVATEHGLPYEEARCLALLADVEDVLGSAPAAAEARARLEAIQERLGMAH